jgi:hypothetical protein
MTTLVLYSCLFSNFASEEIQRMFGVKDTMPLSFIVQTVSTMSAYTYEYKRTYVHTRQLHRYILFRLPNFHLECYTTMICPSSFQLFVAVCNWSA